MSNNRWTADEFAGQERGNLIAIGELLDKTHTNKFGQNNDLALNTEETVWQQGGTLSYSTTADIDTVSSSDASDGQDIKVYGLDADWREVTQTVTLDGQNKVTLPTALIRCYRVTNEGSSGIAGTVYVYVNGDITDGVPDAAGDIRATMEAGFDQTQCTFFTIPKGKRGLLRSWRAFLLGRTAGTVSVDLKTRDSGKAFRVRASGSVNLGGPHYQPYEVPIKLDPMTDIEVTATASANNLQCGASFHVEMEDV